MNTCATCTHYHSWPNLPGRPNDPHGICGAIHHPEDDNYNPDAPAYVLDTEQYHATLRVRPDFGCVLWQPIPNTDKETQ